MRLSLRPVSLVLLPAVVTFSGCGGASPEAARQPPPAGRVISAEQIAKSGAKSAWDALRLTVRGVSIEETRSGRPARIGRRGNSSLYLDDQVQVFVDGLRIREFQTLDDMPASDILRIEVVTGVDATTRFGTNAADGVILIYTQLSVA